MQILWTHNEHNAEKTAYRILQKWKLPFHTRWNSHVQKAKSTNTKMHTLQKSCENNTEMPEVQKQHNRTHIDAKIGVW